MGMKKIYMVVGCPGSGKSWVCNQLRDRFEYVPHDDYLNNAKHIEATVRAAKTATKPLLIETPFSVSQIRDPLEKLGFEVVPVYIQERPDVLQKRYRDREGKDIPQGHLTRQVTYAARARAQGAFAGSSTEILQRLRSEQTGKAYPWE